ncbi:hypothetical protein WOLCODRAFT_165904 [Wolfiporia cocos MD-104 SS10]|uniref:MFS general substrate transporter n=1 Tax=Wolfiporia cocos (strain MD-104) TaxID=742152 RepID=A0A2H3IY30_WOLCO|nr:hypothetical protein WOLCODRAFT_165904 [Wolfiporia cocos MD-104 SS10]
MGRIDLNAAAASSTLSPALISLRMPVHPMRSLSLHLSSDGNDTIRLSGHARNEAGILGTLSSMSSHDALARRPSRFYQLMFAQGVGLGILLVPALSMQSHHWRRRYSFVMGNFFTGFIRRRHHLPDHAQRRLPGKHRLRVWRVCRRVHDACPVRHRQLPAHDAPYLITNIGVFLGLWDIFLPYFYLQLFVNAHRLLSTLAFLTIATLNAASKRDCGPHRRAQHAHAATAAIIGGLVFVMFAAANKSTVIVFAIFYGAFSGAFISLLPMMLASMSRGPAEMGCVPRSLSLSPLLSILAGNTVSGADGEHAGKWRAEAGAGKGAGRSGPRGG